MQQGFIEKSNVNSVAEMSRMIEVTRAYTQIATLLQQQSDLHKTAIAETRRRSGVTAISRRHPMQALHTAATGMAAQELNVQVISNNIANLRTTGYKKQTAAFQDLIYEHIRRVGAQSSDQGTILPVGIDIGGGVKTVGTPRSMTQGTLSQTGNDLDLAITGEGFFKIQMPDGTYQYTRDGTFQMDNQGRIVNAQGNLVQPAITVPQNASGLTVNAQGQVSVTLPGSTTSTIIGQIGLTRFINKAGLQPVGNNLFTDTPSSGPPQDGLANAEGYGSITQGSLEQANVDVVSEMSRPDRRPARLRDERQGGQRRRPDDAIHFRAVPLRELMMTLRSLLARHRPARGHRRAAARRRPQGRRRRHRGAGAARQRHRLRRRGADRRRRRQCRHRGADRDLPRARSRHHRLAADRAGARRAAGASGDRRSTPGTSRRSR